MRFVEARTDVEMKGKIEVVKHLAYLRIKQKTRRSLIHFVDWLIIL